MKYSALIGNPVEHSISPKLFNTLMELKNIEYSHIKIKINSKEELKQKIDELFDLGFIGINITCPYKRDIYNIVDTYEDNAKSIYSINTIYKKNNQIIGCNTDGLALLKAIISKKKINSNTKIVIFGAGGAAYSIFYEISKITNLITIIDQNFNEAKSMVDLINNNAKYYDLNDIDNYINNIIESDIIINATSVGMYPDNNNMILEEKYFKMLTAKKTFVEVVFNPNETMFIKTAKKYNHDTISGLEMLINQAILALEKWTNMKIELKPSERQKIYDILIEELNRNYD